MRAKIGMALVGVLVLAVAVGIAWAQSVPQLINYQGRLADSSGMPLDGVTVDLTFAFYGVESGGTAYLTVLQEDVTVNGGIYNVLIGSGTVTPGSEPNLGAVFQNHQDVWMGVEVDSDGEMTPRARIGSVPYAITVDLNNLDLDGDGRYKPGSSNTPNDDCNDNDPNVYPGAPEKCGLDMNCNGTFNEGCPQLPGMAYIPAGCFDMGDHFNEGVAHELPVHSVCITSSFYMDVHETTNAEYKACVDGGSCTAPSSANSYTRIPYYGNPTYDNYPVIYVDWDQATAYCAWAGKRLPTEAEWEYAARGGLSGKRFLWGDTISCANANYYAQPIYSYETSPTYGCGIVDTSQVESYAANGYGLYDMAGNILEWTNDWYDANYYQYCVDNNIVNDPQGPDTGTYRQPRGGSWCTGTSGMRVATRSAPGPNNGHEFNVGFRCAGD